MTVFALIAAAVLAGQPAAAAPSAATPAGEAALAEFGVEIGSLAPAFTAETSMGRLAGYEELAGENGLVLYFHRSLDWCPNCLAQAIEVNANADAFLEMGYGVAFVSTDTPETLRTAAERRGLTSVEFLADPQSDIINRFGVRDPRYTDPDNRAFGVAYPVAIVLDEAGMVSAKIFDFDGLDREDGHEQPVETLRVLSNLGDYVPEN